MAAKFKSAVLEKVHILKDEQEKVQKKTFTKWINSYLCTLTPTVLVKDLMTDLKDGLLLLNLLEILTKSTLPKEKPKNMQRIHCLTNVQNALQFMEKEKKIKLVNINASDVVDGKPSIVLGLVWTAILHFQIEEQEEFLLQALGMENDPNAKVKGQTRKGLMAWINKALDKYGLTITDFGECWSDGIAFNALVHNIDNSLIDIKNVQNLSSKERLENAFEIAERELGIPRLLDVEDVDVEKPDEKSIMTYVGQFLKSYPECRRFEEPKEKNELELIKEFNENVDKNFENPTSKNDYNIFADLMSQKDEIQSKLDQFSIEDNPEIDKDEMDLAIEDFQSSEAKLKEWQWYLDKNLPGVIGPEVGAWLENAEKSLMEHFPDYESSDFNEKVSEKLKEHKNIFDQKNDILKKFNEIKKKPGNISVEQLKCMEQRLEDVVGKEGAVREKLTLFSLQADLKEKSKKLKDKLNSLNSPITSEGDLINKIKELKTSTAKDSDLDKYKSQLSELINRKATFCKENLDFDQNLEEFLNQSIIESEEDNDELLDKFEVSLGRSEHLSNVFNEITDGEKKLEAFSNALHDALISENLNERKRIIDQIPQILDFINELKEKFQEQLVPHISPELSESIEKRLSDFDDDIQNLGEKVVNQIEIQEEEIRQQQEAARETLIENLISDNQTDIDNINVWINELEDCIGSTINGSSAGLKSILETLEKLNMNAPDIQNQLNKGYQTVIDLKNHNAPEKANIIKKVLDGLQSKFTIFKEKEIPKTINNLKSIVETLMDIEIKMSDLDQVVEESKSIQDYLDNSDNVDGYFDVLQEEKQFLAKEKAILDSIQKDKDLLKKLKEMSNKSNLNIDFKPLEEKIFASEKSLQEVLRNAKENISATNKCNDACKGAADFLDGLSKKVQAKGNYPKDEEGQKAKIKDIEKAENELVKAENLIKDAIAQKESLLPHLHKNELDKIDGKIEEMKAKCSDLRKCLENDKKDILQNLEDWNDYNKTKESVANNMDSIVKDLEKSHDKRKGLHGRDLEDKANLLKENMKRLENLNKEEEKINTLYEMAKRLGSEKPISELQNLKKEFHKQQENLKKEIQQNKKDLENHENFNNNLGSFKDWLQEAEEIGEKIKKLPSTKEGLAEKQKQLKELNKLKIAGNKKLKDLKDLQSIVINETSVDHKDHIKSTLDKEIDRFNKIFNNSEADQKEVNESIEKLDKINEKANAIQKDVKEIENQMTKCLNQPMESINNKEKVSKELKNLDRTLDSQKMQLDNLKSQCDVTNKSAAMLDLTAQLDNIDHLCTSIKASINEKLLENENNIKNQILLEKKLDEFESLMKQTKSEMSKCSKIGCNETEVEENLKKLKKIKSRLAQGKDVPNELSSSCQSFIVPSQIREASLSAKQNYSDLENEIIELEEQLSMQRDEWSDYNSTKKELETWLRNVSGEMEKLIKQNNGSHGGMISEKETLLEFNRKLLEDVLNHEPDMKNFVERFTSLLSPLKQDSAKRTTNELFKKYEQTLEHLADIVQQNEDDLEKHKNYKREIDDFFAENKSIIKNFNMDISNLPNTKDGLKKKINLYKDLRDKFNIRKKEQQNLNKLKNDVVDHSSPNIYQDLDLEWNKITDSTEKTFNILENQEKLLSTYQQIEETERICKELSVKLSDIEKRQNVARDRAPNSTKDIEMKIQNLKDIRDQLKEIQIPINEIHRKNLQNDTEPKLVKDAIDKLINQYKVVNESNNTYLNENENQLKQLTTISNGLSNLKQWLDQTSCEIEDLSKPSNVDLNTAKKCLNSLQMLKEDIVEHKVDISRLQTLIDSFVKISKDNSPQKSLDGLSQIFHKLHTNCQNEAEKQNRLIALMNKYENSRTNVLHWIEKSTQILLKCSDYTLNPSKLKSKLLMIENLEKDLENNGQPRFLDSVQTGEDLMKELSGLSMEIVSQQCSDLKSDWVEICRQLNHLSNNLKNMASRSELFKDLSGHLLSWLDGMENSIITDPSNIEHHCKMPHNETQNNKCDRFKTLLIDLNRRKPDFIQLLNMASDLGNPSFDIENSQIQNRYNRLTINLKDKIEKLSKQQAAFEKIKHEIEEMEKWIFQTSIKIINDNAEQGNNVKANILQIEDLLHHNNEIISTINAKEGNILSLHQSVEYMLNSTDNQFPETNEELQKDLDNLKKNYINLKDTAIHKRDHLIESVKKWEKYQILLKSTKSFLDHEMKRWWKEKLHVSTKHMYSKKQNEKEYKDIIEMENKLNGFKKELENAAKECDGILPTVTTALSRTPTPNYINDQPMNSATLNNMNSLDSTLNEGSIPNLKPKNVYESLEDNLKRLLEFKKENQEREIEWNNYNREKKAFKNWLEDENIKISGILQSSPGISNLDSFVKNKLKMIQDEINNKKQPLSNLNNKFIELTSKNKSATDPDLNDINRDFETIERQIYKLLNREDKIVEANFPDEDPSERKLRSLNVPKLNLSGLQSPRFDEFQDSSNRFTQTFNCKDETDHQKKKITDFYCQTPGIKITQTDFKDLSNDATQTTEKSKRRKDRKESSFLKILNSIRDINDSLEKTKSLTEYGPNVLQSRISRSPNQESIRRNMTPTKTVMSIKQSVSPSYENGFKRTQSLRSLSRNSNGRMSSLSNSHNLHTLTEDLAFDFPQSPWNTSNHSFIHSPNKLFHSDYNSTADDLTDIERPKHSRRHKSYSSRKSASSKNQKVKDIPNKFDQNSKNSFTSSEKLRNY